MPYGGVSGAGSTLQVSGLKAAPSKRSSGRGKPPCKYGPRGPDGYCPKKPKSGGSGRTAKKKPPCKYGPRTSQGLCPKKPKTLAVALDRDRKSGTSPLSKGSSTRTLTTVAAEQAATRAVTRTARKLETQVKKRFAGLDKRVKAAGPVVAAIARALAPVGAIIGAAAYADKAYNDARRREIEQVAAQYRQMIAGIPLPDGGRYDTGRIKAQLQLAEWLRQQLERVNDRYDKRAISERVGGWD